MGTVSHKIVEVSVKTIQDFNKGLLEKHWEELASNKELIKLNPDWDKYYTFEKLGVIKSLAVFVEDKMVGYSCVILQPHLHYSDDLYAFVDVVYVDPEYRMSGVGLKLLNAIENQAKEAGASIIIHHVKTNHMTLGNILETLGYKQFEINYSKKLKE